MTNVMSKAMLCRYVDMRKNIDAEAETIYSLASLLALLRDFNEDRLTIDPMALGHVQQMIAHAILNIGEQLDDFIDIVEARETIEAR